MKRRADGRFFKKITIERDGKKVAKFFYSSAKSEREAQKDINRQLLNFQAEREKVFKKTVDEVADEWERWHEAQVEWTTSKRYRPCVKRIKDWFKGKLIAEVTVKEANAFIEDFAQKYPTQKTVKNQKTVCNQIWRYAIKQEYLEPNNVWQFVTVPKHLKKPERELPTEKEINSIKESVDIKTENKICKNSNLFAYFILYTGLRRGEILALKYSDIDFDNKVIHVTKQIVHEGNKPVIKPPKTKSGIRDTVLIDKLAVHIPKRKTDGYIFCNAKGEPLLQSEFNRMWKGIKADIGIDITPHQLRHAYATSLHEAGINVKDAQYLLGHNDIQTTQQIYTHIRKKQIARIGEQLNAYDF